MKLAVLPKWVRRLVTIPLTAAVFVWLLGLLPLWLVVAAFVSRFVPGRWRAFRLTWFLVVYLAFELVTLAALFALWVASGFGATLRSGASLARHHRLLAWFLRRVMGSARFTFGLRFVDDSDAGSGADPERPLLVFSRHAGAGDSFLLVDAIANGAQPRRPLIVLKDLLQLDPVIDVMLHRVGASFVTSGERAGDAVVAEVARLAAGAGPGDALVLFPEGGNFTPARRERAIEKLDLIGRPDLAVRAERLTHLLPPKPLGVSTAIDAAPTADVSFVGHVGLEALSTPRDIWRNLPTDHTITSKVWRVRAEDVPPAGDERERWLYDQWEQIDQWTDATMVAEATAAAEAAAAAAAVPRTTWRRRMVAPPSFGSALGALLLWWESLRPSMLPRSPLIQGVVGAICACLGFAIGGALHRSIRRVLGQFGRRVPERWHQRAVSVLVTLALLAIVIGPWRWWRWQREHRRLVTMPPMSVWSVIPMMLVTALVIAILLGISRSVKHVVASIDRVAAAKLPVAWSRWIVVGALVVTVVLGAGFAADRFTRWADQNFGAFDTTTEEGVEVPTSSMASGGPGSLVDFDDLGYQGRTFAAGAPTLDQLREFAPDVEVVEPIRVYVGLDSADTLDERLQLAVDELRRTGAFDRQVLVVATPTGTGWINPNAARTLEYMYGGNTAIVGVQYSFLPSWVAMLIDTHSAPELGEALFAAVHAAWAELPADDRPLLVAFGESLGSFGGEEAFAADSVAASVDAIVTQADAALYVGPTRDNPIFGPIVDGRDAGSPTWLPVWSNLEHLRVANRTEDITASADGWPQPRVLYLHHPSDAIGTWEPDNLWRAPGWADEPAAYDIPSAARWTPLVSFAQESFDLMNGFAAAPGFGHDYRNHLAHAWAAIIPPDGWTEADTVRLNEFLGL